MIRAAAYIRVSTEEQVLHGYSIGAQREALERYESEHDDVQIVGWYIDEGVSARKKAKKRKELQHLLNDLEPKQIDMILFVKLDRWFRNVAEYHKVQEILDEHGVHWKAILEDYDTSTSGGRLHINIMLSVAQDEADRTSERIKFVFDSKVARGEAITGSIPYGLARNENNYVIHDPITSPIAQDLFDYYDTYNNLYELAEYSKDRYGLIRSQTALRNMLKNRMYIGEYRGNPNFCPPLIKKSQFNRIQRILANNVKATPSGNIYLFTGLIVCDTCGRKMTSNTNINKQGNIYHYYRCSGYYQRAKLCPHKKQANEDTIEDYLLKHLAAEAQKQICLYDERKISAQSDPAKEREKIRGKLKRLKDLYVNELIDIDDYKTDYDKYTSQLEELDAVPQQEQTPVSEEALSLLSSNDFGAAYAVLDAEGKRAVWRSIIQEIRLDDDNNIVSIKFA